LTVHLATLSFISLGGIPSVLLDLRNFVATNGWVTDREFAEFFAMGQAIPGRP
jgi:chromate transport protein ChrA